jgi:hypothetical protein
MDIVNMLEWSLGSADRGVLSGLVEIQEPKLSAVFVFIGGNQAWLIHH